MLNVAGRDEFAVDVVTDYAFDVVGLRLNTERGRGVLCQLRRRDHLVRLDESNPRDTFTIDKEPQECFAVAIEPTDDLLLPQLPAVFLEKAVNHFLNLHGHVLSP